MAKLVPVDFACNDPDNGLFAGKVWMAQIDGNELERGAGEIAFSEVPGGIRVHRSVFAFKDSTEWFGNWCWNRYWLTVTEANRLTKHLRKHGWRCTCGEQRFYNWMNGAAA